MAAEGGKSFHMEVGEPDFRYAATHCGRSGGCAGQEEDDPFMRRTEEH